MQLRRADRQQLAAFPENWQDIPGYEGLYAAFWKGAILNKQTGKVLTPTVYTCGYAYVTLTKDGRKQNKRLHRLIASTYIHNPENKPEVNHKTGNKLDNHAALLEWNTESENKKHAYRLGLNKGSRPWQGKTNEQHIRSIAVDQYDLQGNFVKRWPSIAEAGRHGFQSGNLCKCCKGERPTHKGYIWKYANN